MILLQYDYFNSNCFYKILSHSTKEVVIDVDLFKNKMPIPRELHSRLEAVVMLMKSNKAIGLWMFQLPMVPELSEDLHDALKELNPESGLYQKNGNGFESVTEKRLLIYVAMLRDTL